MSNPKKNDEVSPAVYGTIYLLLLIVVVWLLCEVDWRFGVAFFVWRVARLFAEIRDDTARKKESKAENWYESTRGWTNKN